MQFGQSTVTDAENALGMPSENDTFSDGSGFLSYEYLGASTLYILQFNYGPNQVLQDASTTNIPRPPCWPTDGGAVPTASTSATPSATLDAGGGG